MKFQEANEKHILFWDTVLNDIYKGKLDDCLDFVDCKEKIFKQLFGNLKKRTKNTYYSGILFLMIFIKAN